MSDGFAHDRGGWATRGTIGPPYASALEGWVAGTTTSRCTTSPSRARWSSRKDTACSECGASSTGARKTRGDCLGGAERGGVVAVAGSESAATARGSARSPVASRGVSLAGGSEEAAAPAISRVFSLRAFASQAYKRRTRESSTTTEERREIGAFSGAFFRVLFPRCFASRRSLPKRARSHHLPPKTAMPNPTATFETTEVRRGRTSETARLVRRGCPRVFARLESLVRRIGRPPLDRIRVGNISRASVFHRKSLTD